MATLYDPFIGTEGIEECEVLYGEEVVTLLLHLFHPNKSKGFGFAPGFGAICHEYSLSKSELQDLIITVKTELMMQGVKPCDPWR